VRVLVAPDWSSDRDLESAGLTAELWLSISSLAELCAAIEAWLETNVTNASLLDGTHHLAASEDFVFDLTFGKRCDLISSPEKPVITLQYKLGKLCGEFSFATDQSCLGCFATELRQLMASKAE